MDSGSKAVILHHAGCFYMLEVNTQQECLAHSNAHFEMDEKFLLLPKDSCASDVHAMANSEVGKPTRNMACHICHAIQWIASQTAGAPCPGVDLDHSNDSNVSKYVPYTHCKPATTFA